MPTIRPSTVAVFPFAAICLLLAACGGLQAGKATPIPPNPPPRDVPTQVISAKPDITNVPDPVGTANAVATEIAAAPTVLAARAATAEAFHNLEATPVLARDYGSWSYRAMRSWPNAFQPATWVVIINREYNIESVQGLKAYAESNRELGGQLADQAGAEPVQVYITFRKYLSREEFNAWVTALGIHPSRVELRVEYDVDPSYTPVPAYRRGMGPSFGPPTALLIDCATDGSEPLPQAQVDAELAKQEKEALAHGYKLHQVKGVYFTKATVQAEQLPAIAASELVFLADISFAWATHDLQDTEGLDRDRIMNGQPLPRRVFGLMEQFGLKNFAK